MDFLFNLTKIEHLYGNHNTIYIGIDIVRLNYDEIAITVHAEMKITGFHNIISM